MNLIVNSQPDLPLRVPIDSQSMNYCSRAESLKQKNLQRLEIVAKNLENRAELEKMEMLEKLKKKKKSMAQVHDNYNNERKMF